MHPVLREILLEMNSGAFIKFLEKLSGIEGLIPDPFYNGGGIHRIERGGKLDVHADYNVHPVTRLDRRVNVLLYLNRDWKDEYGGCLELWDKEMTAAKARILPVFNRFAMFSTTDWSYHGHPDPLSCPEDKARMSFALYYYTNGRPENEKSEPHSTIYKKRPQDITTEEIEKMREDRSKSRLKDELT